MAALGANKDVGICVQPVKLEKSHAPRVQKYPAMTEMVMPAMLALQGLPLDRKLFSFIHRNA
jgi:hypothetical protein